MSTAPAPSAKPVDTRGLAGQTVGETSICAVTQTELIYRGYEIADLAENASFEEVAFLLLVGHKPTAAELSAFKTEVASMRAIPASVRDAIVIGLLLAGCIIWLFLRDAGTALMTGLVVPVTMFVTFIAMRVLGQSFNLMTLGGLAAEIGRAHV